MHIRKWDSKTHPSPFLEGERQTERGFSHGFGSHSYALLCVTVTFCVVPVVICSQKPVFFLTSLNSKIKIPFRPMGSVWFPQCGPLPLLHSSHSVCSLHDSPHLPTIVTMHTFIFPGGDPPLSSLHFTCSFISSGKLCLTISFTPGNAWAPLSSVLTFLPP